MKLNFYAKKIHWATENAKNNGSVLDIEPKKAPEGRKKSLFLWENEKM